MSQTYFDDCRRHYAHYSEHVFSSQWRRHLSKSRYADKRFYFTLSSRNYLRLRHVVMRKTISVLSVTHLVVKITSKVLFSKQ